MSGSSLSPFLATRRNTPRPVTVAMTNRMDLALSIAIGLSVQVALFVAPVLVLLSYVSVRDIVEKVVRGLRPGGIVVIEGFHRDVTRASSVSCGS